ncbi:unnamed protein product [Adineta steineri]|uniref:Uncharacterized protein n=1 Tax=Adineta steineri TaxID=433720 RepID=A0A815LWC0_9BILA|nr:unnamed protein product [Adineta steineri]CAF1617037.1 unnamed protein product [Adineta steineri]
MDETGNTTNNEIEAVNNVPVTQSMPPPSFSSANPVVVSVQNAPPSNFSFANPVAISVQNEPPPPAYTSYGQFVPPPAGYPQAGHPQMGYSQAGHPQAGYPQPGYPPVGYPQAGYPKVNQAQPQRMPNSMVFAPNQGANVSDFMAWSIFNCLCCLWPLGLVAIFLSSMVMEKKKSNNVQGAKSLSTATGIVNGIATVAGIGLNIFLIMYYTQMR